MNVADHIDVLEREGERLAEAASLAGLGAPTPTCPEWQVRDLLAHLGGVHRWATFHVATASSGPTSEEQEAVLFSCPPDDSLLEWFRAGHGALVQTLRNADPAMSCWTFLPAPSPLAFWARRQAHETAIHRVDAELALSGSGQEAAQHGTPTPIGRELAVDGIDELLNGFLVRRRGRLVANPPRTIALHALDSGDAWTVLIESDHRVVESGLREEADCQVAGPASELYLLLWNRRAIDGFIMTGDAGMLDLWRERARITW
ncbi:MAG: hypothetical protein JWO62_851 [Acidimicrobiaceae bacterium]|nr:hypothetical protein [Acidimicrobiaceae bacterium]